MKKPLCRHCGERHYLTEPHVLKEVVTPSNETPVTEGNVFPAFDLEKCIDPTLPAGHVSYNGEVLRMEPHCPTCRCFGPRYKTKAEKQAAYRKRKESERRAAPIIAALGPYKEPDKITWDGSGLPGEE